MKKTNPRPVAYVLVSTNHGTMLVNRNDYRLVEGGGYGIGYQILNTSSFDQPEIDFALSLLQSRRQHFGEGVIAIDCGANIGVHTIEWAQFMTGWGEVISFEAQERIFYALAGNIIMNNCFNARAIWAAVGASAGEIGVPIPDYHQPSSYGSLEILKTENTEFIGQNINYQNTQSTQMIAIDDLKLDRVDLIKIDIEGMEIQALHGALETIERAKPLMLIEHIKTNIIDITNFLSNYGYKIYPMGINIFAIHESDPIADQIKVEN